jgi:hypothetical protein
MTTTTATINITIVTHAPYINPMQVDELGRGEHRKQTVWYVRFDNVSYLEPEQCLLAWVFVND